MGRRTFGDRGDSTNTLRDLKKKIEQLKVENARLRKELNKMNELLSSNNGILDEEDQELVAQEKDNKNTSKEDVPPCSKCNSFDTYYFRMNIGGTEKKYLRCNDCGISKLTKGKR